MPLAKREYPHDTREFVRIGYNDACINFLVKFDKYSFDELVRCIKDVREYNNYKGAKVAAAFEKIKAHQCFIFPFIHASMNLMESLV